MASKGKDRYFQLQDWQAHDGKVNCLRIGRKSGRVLVTGGDDRKVNMWAIGKPGPPIMSLQGPAGSQGVQCVTFDQKEEHVAAGESGGSLRIWDLDQQKVVRNWNGHQQAVTSVDVHPFGEFYASGCGDTQVRVWDLRRQNPIQVFKGHQAPVSVVRFSPDGKWVVSGDTAGHVKMWDLTMGKPVNAALVYNGGANDSALLRTHPAVVHPIEFNPK
eukprot:TRINITY_DN27175_c0_g1_i1.p1 TRINITY_DN27175_c0_g1~~TRINITY_DN27175_c0_g1_i1.p1  ORF type:complete len:216 (+),score=88.63 TRINITY_DN27175_c0_g1_i1:209-856(+)